MLADEMRLLSGPSALVLPILLALTLLWTVGGRAQAGEPPLVLKAKIPLGDVSGRIDHLGIDVNRQPYVANGGDGSVRVLRGAG